MKRRGWGLDVKYKTKQLEKVCTHYKMAVREYGFEMAKKIAQRIRELQASSSVEELVQYFTGRCHQLKGDRAGQYAMDLVHPYRLVFKKEKDILEIVVILSIEDYH